MTSPTKSFETTVGSRIIDFSDIPTSLLVAGVFPYLTRSEWNNFSIVNKTMHTALGSYKDLLPPWPENCLLFDTGRFSFMSDAEWSPDGRHVAYHDTTEIHIVHQGRGHIKQWAAHNRFLISSLNFSPDGGLLASSGCDCRIKIWDCMNDYKCIQEWPQGDGRNSDVAFSPDGTFVAVFTYRSVKLLRADSGLVTRSVALEMGHLSNTMLFSPDGLSLIFGGNENDSKDGVIKIWRTEKTSEDNLMSMHVVNGKPVRHLALSADGSRIASASDDGNVNLWKLCEDGLECLQTFEGHRGYLESVSFTPDEKFLVAGSGIENGCGDFRFWKLDDGTCSRTYKAMGGPIRTLKYSPDGSRLLIQDDSCLFLRSPSPVHEEDHCGTCECSMGHKAFLYGL